MSVRNATVEDIPRIVSMGREFHKASPWSNRRYDDDATAEMLGRLINADDGCLLVSATGMIGGVVSPVYFGGGKVAQELFWYAKAGGLALLRTFERWARSRGADEIIMISLVDMGDDGRVARIYGARGYAPRETHFAKELN